MSKKVDLYNLASSLNQKQNIDLWREWKNGSQKALDNLIKNNIDLIQKAADRYKKHGFSTEDLVNQGVIGFIKALERFDPERGGNLSAYALPSVMTEIAEYVYNYMTPVTVPRDRRLRGLMLKARLNSDQVDKDNYAELNEKEYNLILKLAISKDISYAQYANKMVQENINLSVNPETEFLDKNQIEIKKMIIRNGFLCLTKQEATILRSRYLREDPISLEDLARSYNVSTTWIHKVEKKAFEKFSKAVKNKMWFLNRDLIKKYPEKDSKK
jgi:RNA polymerase sigma-32 factor